MNITKEQVAEAIEIHKKNPESYNGLADCIAVILNSSAGIPAEKVRLTLTRPALERLIGGDAEIEVALRSATAKQIIDKHIVPMIQSQAKTCIMNGVIADVKKEIIGKDYIKGSYLYDQLAAEVRKAVENEIKDAVSKFDVAKLVNYKVKILVEQFVKDELQKELREQYEKLTKSIKWA